MESVIKGKNVSKSRPRDRVSTEKRLLEAAAKSFSKSGFDAATTKSIAELAGVSEGLIHRYFGNKEGLLLAIMRSFLDDSAAHPALAKNKNDKLDESIRRFLDDSFKHHENLADTMRIMVSAAIIDRSLGKKMGDDIWNRHVKEIAATLRSFQKRTDSDKDIEAAGFVLSAFSFVLGFMGRQVFGMERKRLDRVAQWLSVTLAKGLAN